MAVGYRQPVRAGGQPFGVLEDAAVAPCVRVGLVAAGNGRLYASVCHSCAAYVFARQADFKKLGLRYRDAAGDVAAVAVDYHVRERSAH